MSYLKGVFYNTPLNNNDIPQADLNIANKFRSNPLPWKGQFSPQLIEVIIKKYGHNATHILDPFLGSGTSLLEAGTLGISATGSEINPAAILLAQTYENINLTVEERECEIAKVSRMLNATPELVQPILVPQETKSNPDKIKKKLLFIHDKFKSDKIALQLVQSLIILLDFYKSDLSAKKVQIEWNKLKKLIISLPFSLSPLKATLSDARKLSLIDNSIDFVITSPPYINVFNYHQQYRASTEALVENILGVAKSEIGSNRKHRGNRFLTVIQYCLDMSLVFNELNRVCKNGTRVIFVVGKESSVRKTRFFNGELVSEVASVANGFDLVMRQERVFTNRFGQKIFEDILHFDSPSLPEDDSNVIDNARKIAHRVLFSAKKYAPAESLDDLNAAILSIDNVSPSPFLNNEKFENIIESRELVV